MRWALEIYVKILDVKSYANMILFVKALMSRVEAMINRARRILNLYHNIRSDHP